MNTSNNTQLNHHPKLGKLIVLTALKTLGILIFLLGFVIVSTPALCPKKTLKVLDAVGLNEAGYLVQKRLYYRDNSNINLYNLIQRSIEEEKYEDQIEFIELMLNSDDYSKFSEEVDKSTKKTLGLRYSVYADSYDTYLRQHLVIALYRSGRELEAKMMAIDSVYGGFDELYVYLNLIVNDDNLTELQKEIEITSLYKGYGVVSSIDNEILVLEELLSMSSSDYDSVIVLEQLVKLSEIEVVLGKYAGKTTFEEEARAKKETWSNQMSELINKL